MPKKVYRDQSVLDAARDRIAYTFDNFERVYLSFSGGKDSSVMFHLVMDEAKKRHSLGDTRKVGVLIVDLEAQYSATEDHLRVMMGEYKDYIEPHWVALPMSLRNAVTNYEPRWICWEDGKQDIWVRQPDPRSITDVDYYPFFVPGMEFEEFVVLFGQWFAQGKSCAGFVGIRADESLNRFRTIAVFDKKMHGGHRWTTNVIDDVYNIYPIYDWRTEDIWRYHATYPDKDHNKVYDLMMKAGVPLSQQRLCQPYGDDQRRGLWLYHVLEPQTWFKLIARVNGANSGALYVEEMGNVMGYNKISKPDGHTWKSFCNLLLMSLPKSTREHYTKRFRSWLKGWYGRGYSVIPDEAPKVLEDQHWAPSYRRLCKVLLRNDWWCKGLGLTQPKSEAWDKFKKMQRKQK